MHLQMNSTLAFSYIFSIEKDGCSSAQTSFILNGLVLPTFIFIFVGRAIKQLKYSSTILSVRTQLKCVQSLHPFHSLNKGMCLLEPFLFFLKQYVLYTYWFSCIKQNQLFQNQWITQKYFYGMNFRNAFFFFFFKLSKCIVYADL